MFVIYVVRDLTDKRLLIPTWVTRNWAHAHSCSCVTYHIRYFAVQPIQKTYLEVKKTHGKVNVRLVYGSAGCMRSDNRQRIRCKW